MPAPVFRYLWWFVVATLVLVAHVLLGGFDAVPSFRVQGGASMTAPTSDFATNSLRADT
jgi:hypothetical protein